MKTEYTSEELEYKMCEKSLLRFEEQAWNLIEPSHFVYSWHIDAICKHLEAVTKGQIKNLIINIPPRHSKSMTVAVMWPAWEWGPAKHPESQWLFTTYAQQLTVRDSVKCRRLIQHPWYQKYWGNVFQLTSDQNAKFRYDNNQNGYRLATSVGGVGTGEGGTRLCIDDPHNVKKIESEKQRKDVIDWWDQVMPSRVNNANAATVVIMQRVRHDDLIGHIKERSQKGDWDWLVLPMEYDPKRSVVTSIGWSDPRKKEGEILCRDRFNEAWIKKTKARQGTHTYESQYQQNPSPPEGALIQRKWIKYYEAPPKMGERDFVFQTWDLAFKALDNSSYVVGLVMMVKDSNIYVLDRVREKLSFTGTLEAIRQLTKKWPQATAKYIEDAANGPAVMDTLKNEIPGIIGVKPEGSKEARAAAVTPDFEAGNIWFPNSNLAPWVGDYVEQLCQFPLGSYKDDMDATSQGITQARKKMRHLDITKMPPIFSATRETPWKIESYGNY